MRKLKICINVLLVIFIVGAFINDVIRMSGPRVIKQHYNDKIVGFDIDSEGKIYCLTDNYGVQVYTSEGFFLYEYQVPISGDIMFYLLKEDRCIVLVGRDVYTAYEFKDGQYCRQKLIDVSDVELDKIINHMRNEKIWNEYRYILKKNNVMIQNNYEKFNISKGKMSIVKVGSEVSFLLLFLELGVMEIRKKKYSISK